MKSLLLVLVLGAEWRRPLIEASLSDLNRFPWGVEECRYQKERYEALCRHLRKHMEQESESQKELWWGNIERAEEARDSWGWLLSVRLHADAGNETSAVEGLNKLLWHLGEIDYLQATMPRRYPHHWRFPGEDVTEQSQPSPMLPAP